MMIRNLLLSSVLLSAGGAAYAADATAQAPSMLQEVSLGYDLNTLHPSGGSDFSLNGFTAGYNIDFRVSDALPVYVGTGLDWHFLFRTKTYNDSESYNAISAKVKTTFINFNIPLNVSYRVPVADRFFMTPQLGLDFRVQVYGHQKTTASVTGKEIDTPADAAGVTAGSVNLFSKNQLGDNALRRFQLGWHAGLKFQYDSFVLGVSYGTDFVKLRNELGSSNLLVNLGYMF